MQFEADIHRLHIEAQALAEVRKRLEYVAGYLDSALRELDHAQDETARDTGMRISAHYNSLVLILRKLDTLSQGLDKISKVYRECEESVEDMSVVNVWHIPEGWDGKRGYVMDPISDGLQHAERNESGLVDLSFKVSKAEINITELIRLKG